MPVSSAAENLSVEEDSTVSRNAYSAQEWEKMLLAERAKLYGFALKRTKDPSAAEDLVQATFLRALESKHTFQDGTVIGSWLTTICRNLFLSNVRKATVRNEVSDTQQEAALATVTTNIDPERTMIDQQNLETVRLLPTDQRVALEMASAGMSMQDIAESQNVPEGTIKSRVSRGRTLLNTILNSDSLPPALGGTEDSEVVFETKQYRRVVPFYLGEVPHREANAVYPEIVYVDPRTLFIEEQYQRKITKKSIRFIKKIALNWSWSKFKLPNCAKDGDRLFIIDGQHTSIAAASRPDISKIPVMVLPLERIEDRAASFVSLNKNRLAMSSFELYHAAIASGSPKENRLNTLMKTAGCYFPRSNPGKGYAKLGMQRNPNHWLGVLQRLGDEKCLLLVQMLQLGEVVYPSRVIVRAVEILMFDEAYANVRPYMIRAALLANQDLDRKWVKDVSDGKQQYRAAVDILYKWIQENEGL